MKKECETESRKAAPSGAGEVARWQGGAAAGRLSGTGHAPRFLGQVVDEMVFILPVV